MKRKYEGFNRMRPGFGGIRNDIPSAIKNNEKFKFHHNHKGEIFKTHINSKEKKNLVTIEVITERANGNSFERFGKGKIFVSDQKKEVRIVENKKDEVDFDLGDAERKGEEFFRLILGEALKIAGTDKIITIKTGSEPVKKYYKKFGFKFLDEYQIKNGLLKKGVLNPRKANKIEERKKK